MDRRTFGPIEVEHAPASYVERSLRATLPSPTARSDRRSGSGSQKIEAPPRERPGAIQCNRAKHMTRRLALHAGAEPSLPLPLLLAPDPWPTILDQLTNRTEIHLKDKRAPRSVEAAPQGTTSGRRAARQLRLKI